MDMNSFRVLHLINEIKAGAFSEIEARRCFSSVILLYVMIDSCASLVAPDGAVNNASFKGFVNRYCAHLGDRFTADALWASRSSMLHALSHIGWNHSKGDAAPPPMYYFLWPDKREQLEERLRARGLRHFEVMDVRHLKKIAVSGYNELCRVIDDDAEVRALVVKRSEHLGEDLQMMTFLNITKALDGTLGA